MTSRTRTEVLERIRAEMERRLSDAEADAYLSHPMSPEERAEALALIDWFQRRYPTPLERLAYVRQAYRRWTRTVEDRTAPGDR